MTSNNKLSRGESTKTEKRIGAVYELINVFK